MWPAGAGLLLFFRALTRLSFSVAHLGSHADLATYLATVLVGLFDPTRLVLLAEALAD